MPILPRLCAALAAAALAAGAGAAHAQGAFDETAATPPGQAPICTDRPGKASATCTAEAGTFQVESDVVNGAFLRLDGTTTDTWLVTNPTLKYGLTPKRALALTPELDAFKDAAGDGRHLNHVEVVNLGYSLPHGVTLYGEVWGDWNYDPAGEVDQYSADVAAAWGVSKVLQLDAGLNFGLNSNTPGVQGYVGVSRKF